MACPVTSSKFFFFFNDTATTEIYTLSLHDALPICHLHLAEPRELVDDADRVRVQRRVLEHLGVEAVGRALDRSEEHTSELQSRSDLVCRLLLEKKKNRR